MATKAERANAEALAAIATAPKDQWLISGAPLYPGGMWGKSAKQQRESASRPQPLTDDERTAARARLAAVIEHKNAEGSGHEDSR